MKEFMLVYFGGDPDWMENTPPEEIQAAMAKWGAWMAELQERNELVTGGSPLHYSGKRIENDVVTDIAAAEYKELVSGYSIVAAEDIDQAVAIAKTCPIFDTPAIRVEVREVVQMG